MKIGLISDTHIPEAMPELWPQVFEEFQGVTCILHAGDIYDFSVLDHLEKIAPVYAARGNGEDGSGGREVQPDDHRVRETWTIHLGGFNIGLTHYIPMPEIPPSLTIPKWKDRLFPDTNLDVLVYGDTHVEQIDVIDNTLCINPGSPTYPHNLSLQLGTIGFLYLDETLDETLNKTPNKTLNKTPNKTLNKTAPRAEILQLTESGSTPFDWAASRRPW